ncbi:hypothetical protein ANN_22623 [Periplaneta americana]|uniref:Uncharacterized protein n=1 Tax=Periplaneta americana TaxID=6978 RepID=A0ABQ8S8M5_PERAM|nr:hypothetical protein ANN_22623 [Periplaneta americana]
MKCSTGCKFVYMEVVTDHNLNENYHTHATSNSVTVGLTQISNCSFLYGVVRAEFTRKFRKPTPTRANIRILVESSRRQMLYKLGIEDYKLVEMCYDLMEAVNNDNLMEHILFSDEATFHTCGTVHRHNCRMTGKETHRRVLARSAKRSGVDTRHRNNFSLNIIKNHHSLSLISPSRIGVVIVIVIGYEHVSETASPSSVTLLRRLVQNDKLIDMEFPYMKHSPNQNNGIQKNSKFENGGEGFDPVLWIELRRSSMVRELEHFHTRTPVTVTDRDTFFELERSYRDTAVPDPVTVTQQ